MRKTVLITGASRGIGKAIAKAFASSGYELYLVCHKNKKMLEELAQSFQSEFGTISHLYTGDISSYEFVASVFDEISQLDVLINNAGISNIGLLSDLDVNNWHQIIDTNLSSAFYTSKLAIPLMLKNKQGKIINISSVWGESGASMEVAYSVSKGGMNSLTKALSKELAPSNIQVNAIACGAIDTDMNRCFSKEDIDALIEEIPADRMGKPEEIGEIALNLANAPSYLTGQIISVSGGWGF